MSPPEVQLTVRVPASYRDTVRAHVSEVRGYDPGELTQWLREAIAEKLARERQARAS